MTGNRMKPYQFQHRRTIETFKEMIMKRALPLIFVILAGMMMFSCASTHKECAAYAKHESDTTPSYDDVQ